MTEQNGGATPPGWYPDSAGVQRYWDGNAWTHHVAPPPPPDTRSGLARMTAPQRVSAVSLLLVMLAAFLPWASLFGISVLGIEGDGAISLFLAVVGAIVLVATGGLVGPRRTPGRPAQIVLLILAVLVVVVGLVNLNRLSDIGLYLTIMAGIGWTAGAAWQLVATWGAPRA